MSDTGAKRWLLTFIVDGAAEPAGEDAKLRLAAAMEALGQRIAAHDGEMLPGAGGGAVAAFDSPVEAVRCALATQRTATEDDTGPGSGPRFRIGIDLDSDAGKGASAAQAAQAEPGGICLSGAVREQIDGKIDLDAEGAVIAPIAGAEGAARGDWRIAPLVPGAVPAIPISAPKPAPPASDGYVEERPFPLLRVSLIVAAAAISVAVYLVLLRTNPLPEEPQATPIAPPSAPGRVAGPTLPGRPFVPEQAPFVDAADRARLRAEYLTAAPSKALALSRGNASIWYVHGLPNADAAAQAALESCRRNAPEPCEVYAQGSELVWERPLPPVPPGPWLLPEALRVETPFDASRVPLAGPAMRQTLEADYAPRRPSKALALARSGTVGYVTRRPTPEDAVRAALEYCGDLTGTSCAAIALDDRFIAAIPATMRVTGLFRPEPMPPFAEQEYKRLAEHYLSGAEWKAVALGRDGRMGLSVGKASEQDAIDAALAECRGAKPPSTGPGGVAAAVLGTTQPECTIYSIGIFTVEVK